MSVEPPFGICPEHGLVSGSDIENNFPSPSLCTKDGCGEYLERMTMSPDEALAYG